MSLHDFFAGREHFGDHFVDVILGGAVIDQARPQAEVSAQRRIRQVDTPAFDQPLQEARVEHVQQFVPLSPGRDRRMSRILVGGQPAMAEAHRTEFHGPHQFETGFGSDLLSQQLGQMKILADGGAEPIPAVVTQR